MKSRFNMLYLNFNEWLLISDKNKERDFIFNESPPTRKKDKDKERRDADDSCSSDTDDDGDDRKPGSLTCCILMIDILLKQVTCRMTRAHVTLCVDLDLYDGDVVPAGAAVGQEQHGGRQQRGHQAAAAYAEDQQR